jgi:hypothetical protein
MVDSGALAGQWILLTYLLTRFMECDRITLICESWRLGVVLSFMHLLLLPLMTLFGEDLQRDEGLHLGDLVRRELDLGGERADRAREILGAFIECLNAPLARLGETKGDAHDGPDDCVVGPPRMLERETLVSGESAHGVAPYIPGKRCIDFPVWLREISNALGEQLVYYENATQLSEQWALGVRSLCERGPGTVHGHRKLWPHPLRDGLVSYAGNGFCPCTTTDVLEDMWHALGCDPERWSNEILAPLFAASQQKWGSRPETSPERPLANIQFANILTALSRQTDDE